MSHTLPAAHVKDLPRKVQVQEEGHLLESTQGIALSLKFLPQIIILKCWKPPEVTTDLFYSMFKTFWGFRKQSVWEQGLSHSNQSCRQIWVSLYCCPVGNIVHQLLLFANGDGTQQVNRQTLTQTYLISGIAWSRRPVPRYCNACWW